jgi:fucose permease
MSLGSNARLTGLQYRLRFVAFTFVTASGLATLEVAANSYISVLGPPKHAALRLVLAQAFNVSLLLATIHVEWHDG